MRTKEIDCHVLTSCPALHTRTVLCYLSNDSTGELHGQGASGQPYGFKQLYIYWALFVFSDTNIVITPKLNYYLANKKPA